MEIPFSLSLAYRDKIEAVCNPLATMRLKHFVMYIVFNNGSNFILSNVFHTLKHYSQEDYTSKSELISTISNFYLCAEKGSLSKNSQSLLTHKYSVFPTYSMVRAHNECTFVFSVIREEGVENEEFFYEKPVKEFEEFCITFVDAFLDVIIQNNPNYRFAFVLTNKQLRHAVIKQGYEDEISLSQREQECVLLAMQGKKPKHIAKDLNISPYTVEQYLKNIRKLLDCQTLAQAVFECINRGLIERVSPFISSRSGESLEIVRSW